MSDARISIALCTYNGERFLPAQLASMLEQTRLPDELVLCDDGSTDRTLDIAAEFAATAPFPVRIVRNAVNLGSNRNFEQAIGLCTGDLIALSDQDDIWARKRLARSEQALAAHPECGLVFSDALVIDDDGQPTGTTLWRNFKFTPQLRRQLRLGNYTPLARFRFITGATVMFRAVHRPYLFPILGEWIHDGWIALMIACLSGICFVPEPLVRYRRHSSQQVGLGNRKLRRSSTLDNLALRQWASVDAHRVALEDVIAAFDRLPIDRTRGAAAAILAQHTFLRQRLELPSSRAPRLARALSTWRGYQAGARGVLSMAKDVVLPKQDDETGAAARVGYSLFSQTPPAEFENL